MRTNGVYFLAVFVLGLSAEPAAASQERIDMRLEDAGFVMRPADTPEKMARLKRLPPRRFVRRETKDGHYFIYADPDYCKCVLLGDQRAMETYQDMAKSSQDLPTVAVGPSGTSPEQAVIQGMDADIGDVTEGDYLHFGSVPLR